MALSMKPEHLKRYGNVAKLVLKYGRGDLLRLSELAPSDGPASGASALQRAADSKDASPSDAASQAKQLADDLEKLGPTFVKAGQFLSTRADLLPLPYLEALARLQDRVAPFPFEEVDRIIAEELGVRISKAFSCFEETPVAAASLGQVHRAELRSGRLVAVKVQRPNIHERIVEDLEALAEIAGFLDRHTELGRRTGFEAMLEEFRKSLLKELDYREEARNLATVGHNLQSFQLVVVPEPVEDYVTARVLTMEFIHGRKVTALGPLTRMEMDGRPLADELCRAYLHQILVDGLFHADPHPGNVFVTDDGRLALLDLGMVAQLSPTLQEDMLKLMLAIAEGRGEDAGSIVVKLGRSTGEPDEQTVRRRVAEMVTQFRGLRMSEIALGRLIFEAARVAAEGGMRLPRELTMLGKTLLNLDDVGRRLDPSFDPNAAIRRYASEVMRGRVLKDLSPGKLFAGLLEVKEFVEKLPGRLNGLIDAVAQNRVRLKVDAIDEVLLMEGLQKIANRITLGLVISALIIGAALLMRIDTSFRILGYPGLAILFFLAAAVAGLALMLNILLHDLRTRKEKLRSIQKHSTASPAALPE